MMQQNNTQVVEEVDAHTLAGWQATVDLMARICDVPAGLIMRVTAQDIEVFVSSQTDGNPYHVGDKECLAGSGLYCEHVVRTVSPLHVPDARADAKWADNPDIKLDMIAYHGHPILAPSGDVFGTICILDRKPRALDDLYDRLIAMFKTYIEHDLKAMVLNRTLRQQNIDLKEKIARIRTLEGILPMCARCKRIRLQNEKADDPEAWVDLAAYIRRETGTEFSHGMCPVCHKEFYGEDALPYTEG